MFFKKFSGSIGIELPYKNILLITRLCVVIFFVNGCKEVKKPKIFVPYTGPSIEVTNVKALLTDSARPKIYMTAPKQIEFENGDRLFPEGVNIEFYGEKDQKSSILTAKHGKYSRETNIYTVTNDVEIINKEEGKKLNTEELHWNPAMRKIYSDKFVRIETPEQLLTGTGLESNEDFSVYKILKVSGVFPLNN